MSWYKYFSVEIPLLCCTFCFVLQGAILTNLYVYRACYIILGYDEGDCEQLGNKDNNVTAWLEPKVQPTVNHINMVHSVTNNLIPLIFCMFVGTWADKFGRKPFMVLCLAGIILTTAMNTVIIHFKYLSPWWFTLSAIPSLLTGGFTTLMIVISAFITDVTSEKDRLVRLAIFEVIFAMSSVLGNLASSYLFYATSYETIYLIATGLTAFSFVYTIFVIPESMKGEKQPFSFRELTASVNIKDIVKHTIRKRENNARPYVLALIGLNFVFGLAMGEMTVGTLFLREKLHWTLTKITTVNSVTSLGNIVGMLFGTYVLHKKLKIKELPLCLLGLAFVAVADVLRGIATDDYYMYAAYVCGMFFGIPMLMVKTILSLMVAPEEMGKIFALTNILMSLDNMLSSLIYPIVYNATLDINSGLYNFMSLGVHIAAAIIIIFMTRVTFPLYKPTEEENIAEKKKPSISVNNIEVLGINERRSFKTSIDIIDTRRLSQSPSII